MTDHQDDQEDRPEPFWVTQLKERVSDLEHAMAQVTTPHMFVNRAVFDRIRRRVGAKFYEE